MSNSISDNSNISKSFEDIINIYYALKSLGYSDTQICEITGFLHDALNLYVLTLSRLESNK